jgi:hypothetical protein
MSLLPAHMAAEMIKGLKDSPIKASCGRLSVANNSRHWMFEK